MTRIPRAAFLLCLLPALILAGCHGAGDSVATQAADRQSPGNYQPGPAGIDDDSDFDRPNLFGRAIQTPAKGVGTLVDSVTAAPRRLYETATGDTAHKAVLQLEDKGSADNRRAGLNRLLEFDFTRRAPYTRAYRSIGQSDQDPTVRAAALRACNRSRDPAATPLFIKALADQSDLVRLEAAKGLANVPDPNAADPLAKIVVNGDENRDVRIAATDALKYYRTLAVARALSSLLTDHDFSVAWQARRSLVYLTHRDFGYDSGAWLGYFSGPEKPLG